MTVNYLEGSRTEHEWKTDWSWEKLLKWRTVCKKSLWLVGSCCVCCDLVSHIEVAYRCQSWHIVL